MVDSSLFFHDPTNMNMMKIYQKCWNSKYSILICNRAIGLEFYRDPFDGFVQHQVGELINAAQVTNQGSIISH